MAFPAFPHLGIFLVLPKLLVLAPGADELLTVELRQPNPGTRLFLGIEFRQNLVKLHPLVLHGALLHAPPLAPKNQQVLLR